MNKFLQTILFLFCCLAVYSQSSDVREKVYVHLNSSVLLSGETILYNAFLRSDLTGGPSHISSILYVELIGEKEIYHRNKIELKNGTGSGEFFIPSLLPTGKYYLKTYTRWMKNWDDYNLFPINIINPFETATTDSSTQCKPKIIFYTSSGSVVAGVNNLVSWEITCGHDTQHKISARLQNTEGKSYLQITPENTGNGNFTFNPSPGEKFQIILEDRNGNFHFSDFPLLVSNTNIGMNVSQSNDSASFEILNGKQNFRLILKNSQEVYKVQEHLPNKLSFSSKELYHGLNEAILINPDNEIIARELFFVKQRHLSNTIQITGQMSTRSTLQAKVVTPKGLYSVSVRKKYKSLQTNYIPSFNFQVNVSSQLHDLAIKQPDDFSMGTQKAFFQSSSFHFPEQYPDYVKLLPEYNTEIIAGHIYDNSGNPVAGETITFTLEGTEYQFHATKSDSAGRFNFLFDSSDKLSKVYFSTHKVRKNVVFEIENKWTEKVLDLKFPNIYLDSSQVAEIAERSVQIQVFNAYDTISEPEIWYKPIKEFYPFEYSYVFDEYTRFPELKDHFIEYIPSVGFRKNKIKIFLNHNFRDVYPHLILLDGVPVKGEEILEFNPYKIESIDVLNNRYYKESLIADGIINITTFEKNMSGYKSENTVSVSESLPLKKATNTAIAVVAKPKKEADYRTQLYWMPPTQVLENENLEFEFLTSDISGDYEIVIEGFTDEGIPFSSSKVIEVKE